MPIETWPMGWAGRAVGVTTTGTRNGLVSSCPQPKNPTRKGFNLVKQREKLLSTIGGGVETNEGMREGCR